MSNEEQEMHDHALSRGIAAGIRHAFKRYFPSGPSRMADHDRIEDEVASAAKLAILNIRDNYAVVPGSPPVTEVEAEANLQDNPPDETTAEGGPPDKPGRRGNKGASQS